MVQTAGSAGVPIPRSVRANDVLVELYVNDTRPARRTEWWDAVRYQELVDERKCLDTALVLADLWQRHMAWTPWDEAWLVVESWRLRLHTGEPQLELLSSVE